MCIISLKIVLSVCCLGWFCYLCTTVALYILSNISVPKSSGSVAVICGLHYASEVKSRQWVGRGERATSGLEWLLCGGLGFTSHGAMFSCPEDICSPPVPVPPAACSALPLPEGNHLTTGRFVFVFVFFFISRTDWEDPARIGTWDT